MRKRALRTYKSVKIKTDLPPPREMDANAPKGSYQMDRHLIELFPNAAKNEIILKGFREQVARGALQAWAHAKRGVAEVRTARKDAKALLEHTLNFEQSVRRLSRGDIAIRAAEISFAFADDHRARPALVQLLGNISSLREWLIKLDELELIKPLAPRQEPLLAHFVIFLGDMYRRGNGKPPPRGATGPFVRFIAATMDDVGFAGDPGRVAERLPQLTRKYRGQ